MKINEMLFMVIGIGIGYRMSKNDLDRSIEIIDDLESKNEILYQINKFYSGYIDRIEKSKKED